MNSYLSENERHLLLTVAKLFLRVSKAAEPGSEPIGKVEIKILEKKILENAIIRVQEDGK